MNQINNKIGAALKRSKPPIGAAVACGTTSAELYIDSDHTRHKISMTQRDREPKFPLGTRGRLNDGTPIIYVKFG